MSKMGEKFTEQQAAEHMNKVWVTHWDNRFDPPLPYIREKGDNSMGKSGEKFTEDQAKEYEDRGANRSEELADLLTIGEMTDIIAALSYACNSVHFRTNGMFAIRSVMWEARAIAERNEYAGDYDYPEEAS
jgi:hypothetical protein